jgi:hypothetical protein
VADARGRAIGATCPLPRFMAGEPDNNSRYSFCVTYPTGAKRYFQGRVFGYPENVGNRASLIMANPTIEIDSKIVKVAAPAGP